MPTTPTSKRDDSQLMRIPIAVYEVNKAIAQVERRNMNAQLELIFEAGVEALGYQSILDAVRDAQRGPSAGAA